MKNELCSQQKHIFMKGKAKILANNLDFRQIIKKRFIYLLLFSIQWYDARKVWIVMPEGGLK